MSHPCPAAAESYAACGVLVVSDKLRVQEYGGNARAKRRAEQRATGWGARTVRTAGGRRRGGRETVGTAHDGAGHAPRRWSLQACASPVPVEPRSQGCHKPPRALPRAYCVAGLVQIPATLGDYCAWMACTRAPRRLQRAMPMSCSSAQQLCS
ncbi:hypothetical protein DFH06DRAFT_1328985 [Mycena polygramma]|nr:hypothetical protein DFH06DRAFT_1328985 [Mycena polygramma]